MSFFAEGAFCWAERDPDWSHEQGRPYGWRCPACGRLGVTLPLHGPQTCGHSCGAWLEVIEEPAP